MRCGDEFRVICLPFQDRDLLSSSRFVVLLLAVHSLQDVRDDGFSILRIIFKRVQVPLVIEQSDHNLIENDEAADHEPCH